MVAVIHYPAKQRSLLLSWHSYHGKFWVAMETTLADHLAQCCRPLSVFLFPFIFPSLVIFKAEKRRREQSRVLERWLRWRGEADAPRGLPVDSPGMQSDQEAEGIISSALLACVSAFLIVFSFPFSLIVFFSLILPLLCWISPSSSCFCSTGPFLQG